MNRPRTLIVALLLLIVTGLLVTGIAVPFQTAAAAGTAVKAAWFNLYARPAPNYDLNRAQKLKAVRRATSQQLEAVEALKASSQSSRMTVRWNDFGGSPDVLMDFASAPLSGSPEEAGRAFLSANASVFGIRNIADLRLVSDREALGGHLLRFQQTAGGIDVVGGGIGLVMNASNQVIMASGPHFRDVNVSTTPALSAEQAKQKVDADLARFQVSLSQQIQDLLKPGLDAISKQLTAAQNLEPKLGIYPTANGYRLVWKVAKYSTNPFGLYLHMRDANTGACVSRPAMM
jgi:Zn-dependent metalloprotease